MKISLNWLKQYVDIPKELSPQELALKLTMSTVEVEEVIDQKKQYENMVVGEIIDIVDHPQADKLKVCKVRAGKEEYQVICGAGNIYKGMKSVLALPGAWVKWHGSGGLVKLEKTKIRGVESVGMLCAPAEVGLADQFNESAGVIDLGNAGKPGQPAVEVLGLDDVIFDIDNKSITHRSDLWGHYGMAREVAAILGTKLKALEIKKYKAGEEVDLKISIEDKENCSRYIGVMVGNIKIEPSPFWMQNLLKAAGVRPINNIVDITNFVMMELGRPSHAFDRRQVAGDTIIVRKAGAGEKFKTLDGQERKMSGNMCLVCDAKRPIDLGGIMGGENSEIKEDTTEILLELANFNPANIRKTATSLGLRTDAAARFEKGLASDLAQLGLDRIITLILELLPEAKLISRLVDVNNDQEEKREIDLSLEFLNKRLGETIPKKEVVRILESLSFKIKDKGENLLVTPPYFRTAKSVSLPEDLVEEVARIYGFDNIKPVMPLVSMEPPAANHGQALERKIRQILTLAGGAAEVYNYSFTGQKNLDLLGTLPENHYQLQNFFSEDQKYLRITLFENIIINLEDNLRFYDKFNIFELGRVYLKERGEYNVSKASKDFLGHQPKMLGGLILDEKKAFFQVKGLIELMLDNLEINYDYCHQAKCLISWLNGESYLEIKAGDEVIGWLAELNNKILSKMSIEKTAAVWQFNLSSLLKYAQDNKKYQPLPKYPGITYDFSILVPAQTTWADIRKEVAEKSRLIKRVELFDIYQKGTFGTDKKSLAFHVEFLDKTKTLTSDEADNLRDKIIDMLKKKFKAEMR